ncbi:hypothetical protein RC74_09740 [Falsihalocynthiibacter arcticus]|uniref:Uncharacterized protein n=1 Tax=Falsihalocynthiibacter arcticus TaxID=1579316 RepID=A0A126UZL9_9RHOB|nr:hypothetical protein RC74_09740 [Falsihalocynthiibacter arcticus]
MRSILVSFEFCCEQMQNIAILSFRLDQCKISCTNLWVWFEDCPPNLGADQKKPVFSNPLYQFMPRAYWGRKFKVLISLNGGTEKPAQTARRKSARSCGQWAGKKTDAKRIENSAGPENVDECSRRI